jgi:hypothetical protein
MVYLLYALVSFAYVGPNRVATLASVSSPDMMSRRMGYTRPALKPCISPRGMCNCSRARELPRFGFGVDSIQPVAPGAVF